MTREPSLGLVTTHRDDDNDDDSDDDSDSDDGAAVSLTPDSGSDQGAVTGAWSRHPGPDLQTCCRENLQLLDIFRHG